MAELVAQLQEEDGIAHDPGSIEGSLHDSHVASHDSRHLSEQGTSGRRHRHRSRSRSHSYNPPVDKGSVGNNSRDSDTNSRDVKHSSRHERHRSHSHKHKTRSQSSEKKHKHKHKHKHEHVKD